MIRRGAGIVAVVFGLSLAGWTAFNLLVEVQPEAEGGSIRGAVLLSIAFLWVGAHWLRGRPPPRV